MRSIEGKREGQKMGDVIARRCLFASSEFLTHPQERCIWLYVTLHLCGSCGAKKAAAAAFACRQIMGKGDDFFLQEEEEELGMG